MDWKKFLKPTWKKVGYYALIYCAVIPIIGAIILSCINGPSIQNMGMLFLLIVMPFLLLTEVPYLIELDVGPMCIIPATIAYFPLIYLIACVIETDLEKKIKITLASILIAIASFLGFMITMTMLY